MNRDLDGGGGAGRLLGFLIPGAALLALALPLAAAAAVPTDFQDQLVVSGLSQPSGFAFVPDGRIVVVEQKTKNVRLVANATLGALPVLTIPDVNTSGNERGLLGVAVDPRWPAQPYIYFHFTGPGTRVYVRRYTGAGDLSDPASFNLTLANPYDILNDAPDVASNHNGGTVRFGPDQMLYVSLGDDADMCQAQVLSKLQGKILRLHVYALSDTGSGPPPKSLITPPDNPFPGPDPNERLVWAFGLRNPFRFNVDPATGKLYIADVGQNTYEELDECSGGEDFGWPHREGAHPYAPGSGCPIAGPFVDPIYEYDRTGFTASIVSGPRYRPAHGVYDFPDEYFGDVFLLEYYQGLLRRLHYDAGSGTWSLAAPAPGQPSPTDWANGLANVSDLQVGPDGAIYYLKQFSTASLRRIVYLRPASVGEETTSGPHPPSLSLSPNPGRPGNGVEIEYGLPHGGEVTVVVYSPTGERVATVFAGFQTTGTHRLAWDGQRDAGREVAPGVYLVRVRGPFGEATGKITMVR